jgi:hypothetical protein
LQQAVSVGNSARSTLVWLGAGPDDASLLDTRGYEDLLHYSCITGGADAAICIRDAAECMVPKSGLCVLFRVAKEVSEAHEHQAACQLVLANLASEFKPVTILTDLAERWQLFWLDDSTVWHTRLASRRAAIAVIQGFVAAAEAAWSSATSATSATTAVLPQVVADRKSTFLAQRVAGVVMTEADAQLLSQADQLPPEDALKVRVRVFLRQLSMQPALCGFARGPASP